MLEHLRNEANRTRTENGAATLRTTNSDCLDLFATLGGLRSTSDGELIARFERAWAEDADLAMKILFYGRDVRGGLGERRIFRALMRHLANAHPASARRNIESVAEFGRYDDLLCLLGTRCEADVLAYLKRRFAEDMAALTRGEGVSLLGKWLPSVNASNAGTVAAAKRLARAFGLREADYRKALSRLRERIRILENSLRERDYTFDYERQPSGAMFKYRKAFRRNDGEKYAEFLERVERGEAKLHAGTLMPYQVIEPALRDALSDEERRSLDATWKALPDFAGDECALAVVDGSGSMYQLGDPRPILVSVSLGMYFAERNRGEFRDHFITFSGHPQLVKIEGADVAERAKFVMAHNEAANTDLTKVFQLILRAAVRHRVPQEQMPAALYILSDMEFDACVDGAEQTNFERAKAKFEAAGYRLPRVVFWNVQSRNVQQPVSMNEQGVALVSGASARVFGLLRGGITTPLQFMLSTLGAERYARIAA